MYNDKPRICDTCGGELQHVGGSEYHCNDCSFFLRETEGILRRVYRPESCPKEDGTVLSPCAVGYSCLKEHYFKVYDRFLILIDGRTGEPLGQTWLLDEHGEIDPLAP